MKTAIASRFSNIISTIVSIIVSTKAHQSSWPTRS
jgi:hypothetical protein